MMVLKAHSCAALRAGSAVQGRPARRRSVGGRQRGQEASSRPCAGHTAVARLCQGHCLPLPRTGMASAVSSSFSSSSSALFSIGFSSSARNRDPFECLGTQWGAWSGPKKGGLQGAYRGYGGLWGAQWGGRSPCCSRRPSGSGVHCSKSEWLEVCRRTGICWRMGGGLAGGWGF